jgi:Domain of unknown function (DUF6894)
MARYFFRLTDGKQTLNNHRGIDLAGPAAAREDAVALAADLRHGAAMPGFNWSGWFVSIVDEHGHKVDEVPVADAVGER